VGELETPLNLVVKKATRRRDARPAFTFDVHETVWVDQKKKMVCKAVTLQAAFQGPRTFARLTSSSNKNGITHDQWLTYAAGLVNAAHGAASHGKPRIFQTSTKNRDIFAGGEN